MGKAVSLMKRPFKNFNVESRAHKIISKEKPTPAPKYEADSMLLEKLMKENPNKFQETMKKDEQLGKNLKNVFVTSESTMANNKESNLERPLPLDRSHFETPTFGIVEPERVHTGKVTLVNALKFITNHYADAATFSIAYIAKKHSLPEETVKDIIKFCKPLQVFMPENVKTKARFARPSEKKIEFIRRSAGRIEDGNKKDDT